MFYYIQFKHTNICVQIDGWLAGWVGGWMDDG